MLASYNYYDVIMSAMTSQITGVSIGYSTICLGTDQRKHQSSASFAFVRGIQRWRWEFPGNGEFSALRTSNAENASIWWRHYVNVDRKNGHHCASTCSRRVNNWWRLGITNAALIIRETCFFHHFNDSHHILLTRLKCSDQNAPRNSCREIWHFAQY